jgi:hypothetical protein
LMVWDIVGLSARIVTLIALVRFIGVWASPIALAVAESIQLGAWIGCVRFGGAKER